VKLTAPDILLRIYEYFSATSVFPQRSNVSGTQVMFDVLELQKIVRQRLAAARRQEIVYYAKIAELLRERHLLAQKLDHLHDLQRSLLRRIASFTLDYHATQREYEVSYALRFELERESLALHQVRTSSTIVIAACSADSEKFVRACESAQGRSSAITFEPGSEIL
jgi:hypothetical protein